MPHGANLAAHRWYSQATYSMIVLLGIAKDFNLHSWETNLTYLDIFSCHSVFFGITYSYSTSPHSVQPTNWSRISWWPCVLYWEPSLICSSDSFSAAYKKTMVSTESIISKGFFNETYLQRYILLTFLGEHSFLKTSERRWASFWLLLFLREINNFFQESKSDQNPYFINISLDS